MAVPVLTWSTSNGGSSVEEPLDHGNAANGDTTSGQEIFVRHDGVNSITSCGLYIRTASGTYQGAQTAADDYSEIISWGDGSVASNFGGVQFNMMATSSYPAVSWPSVSSKSPSGGFVARTGVGDSPDDAVSIVTGTGATATGTIQAGTAPNVRFKQRVQIPQSEDTTGIRQWDVCLKYDYTS